MLGPDLLVAPVVTQGADSREVYLPEGVQWVDAWTEEDCPGGQCVLAFAAARTHSGLLAQGERVRVPVR